MPHLSPYRWGPSHARVLTGTHQEVVVWLPHEHWEGWDLHHPRQGQGSGHCQGWPNPRFSLRKFSFLFPYLFIIAGYCLSSSLYFLSHVTTSSSSSFTLYLYHNRPSSYILLHFSFCLPSLLTNIAPLNPSLPSNILPICWLPWLPPFLLHFMFICQLCHPYAALKFPDLFKI